MQDFGPFAGVQTFIELEGTIYFRLDPSHPGTKSVLEKIEEIKKPKLEMSMLAIGASLILELIDAEDELLERVALIEKMRQETSKTKKSMFSNLIFSRRRKSPKEDSTCGSSSKPHKFCSNAKAKSYHQVTFLHEITVFIRVKLNA